jgi:hypothetical protein
MAVLPRRAWCGGVIPDPHCPNAAGIGWAEGAITVAKQMTWRFVPGTFPFSMKRIRQDFVDVPENETRMMVRDNAAHLYGID